MGTDETPLFSVNNMELHPGSEEDEHGNRL
jgi:hypothetical protein